MTVASTYSNPLTGCYYLRIIDPDLLRSKSLRTLINIVTAHVSCGFARATALETVPALTQNHPSDDTVLTVGEILELLESITQVVEGRFFFFDDLGTAESAQLEPLIKAIGFSQVTVCASDNTSYDLFTTSLNLAWALFNGYQRVKLVKDDLIFAMKSAGYGPCAYGEKR